VRPPAAAEIRAPEFPAHLEWLNVAMLRMSKLVGRNAALIEFIDFARVNSHRTLPYLKAWHERYHESGLRVIGVHCPGYSFGVDPELVRRWVEAEEIEFAVALDPGFEIWREYGNQGWPGRYLFDGSGLLRWVHYGEGDYQGSELAIQEALRDLDPEFVAPEPLMPVRPEDAEGVLLEPQTADIAVPRDLARLELDGRWSEGEDFVEALDAGARARVRSFSAGAAYAVLAGEGVEPGIHESDGEVVAAAPGFRLYGFQFTPATP
jgi:hypothetical protein